jgi:hypothetical protein
LGDGFPASFQIYVVVASGFSFGNKSVISHSSENLLCKRRPGCPFRPARLKSKSLFLVHQDIRFRYLAVRPWVKSWWSKEPAQDKIASVQTFSKDCEIFLASLVSSFQKQANEVASLNSKVKILTLSLGDNLGPSPTTNLFASLQQTLGEGSRTSGRFSQDKVSTSSQQDTVTPSEHAARASIIAALEQKVRILDANMVQLSSNAASTTVHFGGAGFASPRDVLPLIQAEMPTAYFGCSVNAAILLEWIQGNMGDDSLKSMETMRKLKFLR